MAVRAPATKDSARSSTKSTESPPDAEMVQKKKKKGCCKCLRSNLLLILTLTGVAAGLGTGYLLKDTPIDPITLRFIAMPGEILMSMFRGIVVPLIVVSIVAGIANMNAGSMGRLNGLAFGYYFATTIIAVTIGLALVTLIHPGNPDMKTQANSTRKLPENLQLHTVIYDLIINLFPDNLFSATFQSRKTVKTVETVQLDDGESKTVETYKLVSRDGSNILGLLVYSFVFGLLISYAKEKGQFLKDLFTSLDYLIGRFVNIIIWYSPIGIFSLLLQQMILNPDFSGMVKSLGMYVVTVVSGLFIHLFFVLFPLYIIFARKNPLKLVKGVAEMLAVAFGASSSVAALPLHFKCLQENMGVSKQICQMVLPVACTVNMNGTALYEAVASIFIAQLNGVQLTFINCIIVSLMSTIAALGAAAIPNAGLFTMVMILSALNVPIEDISLVMSIDWLLDRIRTTINCLGDSVGASIIDRYAKKRGMVEESTMMSSIDDDDVEKDEEESTEV